ncbi:MAG: hypothetical protein FJZ09_05495, partial [Candidatus Omnitrophica bacterium]|nr:hypothetical protein [Candidatus Omnitrophota bacterium]
MHSKKPRKFFNFLALLLSFLLIFEQSGFAQIAGQLDISGYFNQLRNSLTTDKFRPLHLRYLSYEPSTNNFKILLDKGNQNNFKPKDLENTSKELLNYFFIGVTLPNDAFWVNLRPDASSDCLDPLLENTDIGRVFLEADVQLKKDTSLATSPNTPEGKEYWQKLYQKAEELFGTQNLTIPTLTRPWIVPDEIILRETSDNAYIYKATLKVMLEEDYIKTADSAVTSIYKFDDPRLKELNSYSTELIRELIIPKLTKEVNSAKKYAHLRQVYYSLILAQWFKQRFQARDGLYSWMIDRKELNNLTSKLPWDKTDYFNQYQKSFKEGEYNFKTPVQSLYGNSIRSYFSGGMNLAGCVPALGPVATPGSSPQTRPLANGGTCTTLGSDRSPQPNSHTQLLGYDATRGEVRQERTQEEAGQQKEPSVSGTVASTHVATAEIAQESTETSSAGAEIIAKAQKEEREGTNYSFGFEELQEIVRPLFEEARSRRNWLQICRLLPYRYRYHLLRLMIEDGMGDAAAIRIRDYIRSADTEAKNLKGRIRGTQLELILRELEVKEQKTVEQLLSEAERSLNNYDRETGTTSNADALAGAINFVLRAEGIASFINRGILFVGNGSSYHVSGLSLADISRGTELTLYPGIDNAFGAGLYSSELPLLHYAGGEGLGLDYNEVVIIRVPVDAKSRLKIARDESNPENVYLNLHSSGRAVILRDITVREVSVLELKKLGAISLEKVSSMGRKVYLVEGKSTEFDGNYQERPEYKEYIRQSTIIKTEINRAQTPQALKDIVSRLTEAYGTEMPRRIENALNQARVRLGIAAAPSDSSAPAAPASGPFLRSAWEAFLYRGLKTSVMHKVLAFTLIGPVSILAGVIAGVVITAIGGTTNFATLGFVSGITISAFTSAILFDKILMKPFNLLKAPHYTIALRQGRTVELHVFKNIEELKASDLRVYHKIFGDALVAMREILAGKENNDPRFRGVDTISVKTHLLADNRPGREGRPNPVFARFVKGMGLDIRVRKARFHERLLMSLSRTIPAGWNKAMIGETSLDISTREKREELLKQIAELNVKLTATPAVDRSAPTLILPSTKEKYGHLPQFVQGWIAAVVEFWQALWGSRSF